MWSHLKPGDLGTSEPAGDLKTGSRVAQYGTVSFVRSGFARVRWDNGRASDEWAAELIPVDDENRLERS